MEIDKQIEIGERRGEKGRTKYRRWKCPWKETVGESGRGKERDCEAPHANMLYGPRVRSLFVRNRAAEWTNCSAAGLLSILRSSKGFHSEPESTEIYSQLIVVRIRAPPFLITVFQASNGVAMSEAFISKVHSDPHYAQTRGVVNGRTNGRKVR